MVGQGRPKASQGRILPAQPIAAAVAAGRGVLTLLLILIAPLLRADDVRVRIAWGGGQERLWHGTITVSEGLLSDPQPLGIEADEPGSMWLDGDPGGSQKLFVQQRSPRGYDGVDLLVAASPRGVLQIQLSGDEDSPRAAPIEVPLADISGEFVNKELDNRGNRLLLMRTPGDSLRISLARDNLVFAPGEKFSCTLEPHALPMSESGRARIKVQLLAGSRELWSQQHDVQGTREDKIPLEIPLPTEEGVYDIAIAAVNNQNWSRAVRQPLSFKRTIAERRVQLLVLGQQRPAADHADGEFTQLVEIDPANPRWYDKLYKLPHLQLAKARLPRLWKGPLGNDCFQTRRHPLGELAQLNPNADSPDVSWQAYWLPVSQPGRPHILEVDYPSDVSQSLGITIVEPNAAGALMPIGLNSGVDCETELIPSGDAASWQRHRLVFWPRTTTPLVLITNGRDRAPAVYGKIRVLSGGDRLSRLLPNRPAAGGRLLAAYLDRPLLSASFSAEQCLDSWSGRSLDDWWTFYESGTRLVEYLNYAGYNALMLGVVADGSTIYPSRLLAPTPRYDSGAFFATGQDPVRKDVLEMLLRIFDRQGLQLIPTVEFAAPLPELEAIRRAGGPNASGLEWIGADGASLCASSPAQRGLAPYYNVLHPRVQQAMLGVLRELTARYAQHPSFAGLAVRLSADGYAQLPGPDWGLDDTTIAQFERDARLRVPGEGPQRFAQRAAFLAQELPRRAWLEWRAAQLSKFYRRAYEQLAAIRPDSRLYLAGAGILAPSEVDSDLRPALPRRTTVEKTLLRVGIDARQFDNDRQRIVVLRPERVLPHGSLSARASDLEVEQANDFDRYFQTATVTGSLFFHQPRELRVESFDQKCPFRPSSTWLISQPVPSGQQNRQRFAHSIATLDSQAIVDGGWLLPMGQEDAMRDLVAAYRTLPAAHFQAIGDHQASENMQPVTLRSATLDGHTYIYVVNDAPFGVTARFHVEATAACYLEEITGRRKVEPLRPDTTAGLYWEVRLEPYDLVAVRLSEPNVPLSNPQISWPGTVAAAVGSQIHKLGARAAALRNPPPLDVLANPDFERVPSSDGPIPDWSATSAGGVSVHLDKAVPHGGQQSVRMASTGAVTCLVSHPFAPPPTGRLSMSVWLHVADAGHQPPLRLALEGKLNGRDYYRFAPIGLAPVGQQSCPIAPQWAQYVFQVDDLPLEGLTSLRRAST